MKLTLLLGLLVGGAFGKMDHTNARPDLYDWDQLDSYNAEFQKLAQGMEQKLAELAERRAAFGGTEDKAAWMREHARLLQDLGEDLTTGNELRTDARRVINKIQITAVARGFALKEKLRANKKVASVTSRVIMYQQIADDRKNVYLELFAGIKNESDAFIALRTAYLEGEKKKKKRLLIGGVAAAAVVIGALCFMLGRGGREPEIMPVALGSSPATVPGAQGPITAAVTGPCPQLPAVIGDNFEIIRLIGQGGMGQVFEAQDRALGRRVAVKQMRQELMQSEKELEQFLTEARLVASLKHPNLVDIHSIVKEAGQVYLIFEFVSGKTLHGVLEARDHLPWKEAKYILKCVASALDYAHSRKIVHRDLKPANVMVSREGVVKVMDFGIAYQAKSTIARLTRADAWGTPPYMAPEQEMGGVSSGVDLYALAVCFYQTLTGELPFSGPNFLAQKREEFFEPPSRRVSELPAGVDEVFKKALAAEASKRFTSGADFVAAVARL